VCPVGRGLYPAMLHVHTVLSQCRFGPVECPIGYLLDVFTLAAMHSRGCGSVTVLDPAQGSVTLLLVFRWPVYSAYGFLPGTRRHALLMFCIYNNT